MVTAQFFGFLGTLINIYMMIVFFRIILTWFSGMGQGRVLEILSGITDPYLNWFRRFGIFRVGNLDLSPIVAISVLSLINRIFITLSFHGTISLGIIFAMILQAFWGMVSFLIGFLIVILILRLIAHLTNRSGYGYFWRIIDTIAQPVLYRINRLILKGRIINYGTSIIISIVILGLIYAALRFLIAILAGMLAGLPI